MFCLSAPETMKAGRIRVCLAGRVDPGSEVAVKKEADENKEKQEREEQENRTRRRRGHHARLRDGKENGRRLLRAKGCGAA